MCAPETPEDKAWLKKNKKAFKKHLKHFKKIMLSLPPADWHLIKKYKIKVKSDGSHNHQILKRKFNDCVKELPAPSMVKFSLKSIEDPHPCQAPPPIEMIIISKIDQLEKMREYFEIGRVLEFLVTSVERAGFMSAAQVGLQVGLQVTVQPKPKVYKKRRLKIVKKK